MNDEEIDFTVHTANAADGVTWITLRCSSCGNIASSVRWNVVDLHVRCEAHHQRRHVAGD